MDREKTVMPKLVIVLLLLIVATFIADQLSAFFDTHWQEAELSFDDPVYLGLTLVWLAITIWILFEIIKRKKGISITILLLSIVVIIFFASDLFLNQFDLSLFISFQFLEVILWLGAFVLTRNSEVKEWLNNT